MLARADHPKSEMLIPALTRELHHAWQTMLTDGHAWAKKPNSSTGKLDGLAVDSTGRLLVIEVKSAAADDVGTTPVQVAFYLLLLRAWINQDEAKAHDALSRMIAARHRLGLLEHHYEIRRPMQEHLRPVVALGGAMSDDQRRKANDRMGTCVKYMTDAGLDLRAELELWWMPKLGGVWTTFPVGELTSI
jgi:hypothetical protein